MYNYNNKDRSKEEGLNDWYSVDINKPKSPKSPYKRIGLLYSIWKRIKILSPFTSTKGCCK